MTMVLTAEGLLPLDKLEIKEIHGETDRDVSIAREWYYEGRLVRRDAWVTLLRGVEAVGETGTI